MEEEEEERGRVGETETEMESWLARFPYHPRELHTAVQTEIFILPDGSLLSPIQLSCLNPK